MERDTTHTHAPQIVGIYSMTPYNLVDDFTIFFLQGCVKCLLQFKSRPQAITWTSEKLYPDVYLWNPESFFKMSLNKVNLQLITMKNVYWAQCDICSVVNSVTANFYPKRRRTYTHARIHTWATRYTELKNNTLSLLFIFLIYWQYSLEYRCCVIWDGRMSVDDKLGMWKEMVTA